MAESDVEVSTGVVVDLTEKTPIRVLHVDDEAVFLKVAKQCLEMEGPFQVETASSVEEAMEKMKKKTFDVIVSDYVMPGKDGLEFLKELRDSGNDVPFIIFTEKGREEVAIKALNLGADRYLNKGGDPETVYGELAHSIFQTVSRKRAEKMLRESEEKYRNLFENAKDVIVLLDLKGNITSINKAAVEYGFKKDEVIEKNMRKFVPKRYWLKLLKELVQIARGKTVESRIEIITPRGKKDAEYRSDPMIVDNRVVGVQSVLRDITEHKRAGEELRSSEQRLKVLFEYAPDAYYLNDLKGNFVDGNRAAEELTGYNKSELIGKSFLKLKLLPRSQIPKATKLLAKNALGRPTGPDEFTLNRKDGTQVSVEIRTFPIKIKDQTLVLGIARDISERKKAEERIRESEEMHRDIFENAGDAMIYLDTSGRILNVNREAVEVFGGLKEELLGKHFIKVGILSLGDAPRLMSAFAKGLTRKQAILDICIKNKKGREILLECSGSLMKIHGKSALLVIARDVTERKEAEERIRKSEEKYRGLVELAPDGIVTVDLKGMITSVNGAFSRLTGFSKDEIVGKHFTKLRTVRARDMPKYLKLFSSILRGKIPPPLEFPYLRKDGTTRWGEARACLVKEDGKTVGIQAILRDITERKKREETVRESQQKFERLFANNPEAADFLDPTFHIVDVNPRFEDLFGYSRAEIKGKHINDVVVPEDKMEEAKKLDKKAGERIVHYDTVRKRKDGSLVPVSISAAPIIVEGKLIGTVGLYKDISQLKKAEKALRDTLEELKMANEKMRVVGRLTRHDVRNKLSAVTGNIFLTKQKVSGDREALTCLQDAESAVRQVERIFDFARTYEKLGDEELTYMNVEKTVKEAVSLFSDLHGIKLINDCRGLTVLADSLLRQLFYNLIDNTLKYGEKASKIRIYYKEVRKDQLKLVYEDDGVGIPKPEKEKIFKEGYGKGTGYGLYLIRKICEVYGWSIRETGKDGKGAQFTITIPKVDSKGKILYKLH